MVSPYLRRKRQSKELASISQKLDELKPKPDSILVTLSHVAQVAMVGIVIWGYFFTVMPVMQKEKLAEEVAKLEIEQGSLDIKLAVAESSLFKKEAEMAQIVSQQKDLLAQISQLNLKRDELESGIQTARNEYSELKSALKQSGEKLDDALATLLATYKATLLGSPSEEASLTGYGIARQQLFQWIENIEPSSEHFQIQQEVHKGPLTVKMLEFSRYTPLANAYLQLDKLENEAMSASGISKYVKERLFLEFKEGLVLRESSLSTPQPDFASWYNYFLESTDLAQPFINRCVDSLWSKRIEDEGWSPRVVHRLKQDDPLR